MSGAKKTTVRETVTTKNGVRTVTREEITVGPDGRTTTTKTTTTSEGSSSGASGDMDDFDKRFAAMSFSDDRDKERKPGLMSRLRGGDKDEKPKKLQSTSDFVKEAVDQHNVYRKKHQVDKLKESKDLTKYAQDWADHLASTSTFGHSKCDLKGERLGENVATKWSSEGPEGYTGKDPVDQWYSEVSKYSDYSGRSVSSGTGHFTQVVWKGSREVGIGRAVCKDGRVIVVGSYRPAGNMMGDYGANVFPPK